MLLRRLQQVPPFPVGFLLLTVLQTGADRVDPTAGRLEQVIDLGLVAFALSGLVVTVVAGHEQVRSLPPQADFAARAALLASALLLVVLVPLGVGVNGLVDLGFVVALLLLAVVTQGAPAGRAGRLAGQVVRWAAPAAAAALALVAGVTAYDLRG